MTKCTVCEGNADRLRLGEAPLEIFEAFEPDGDVYAMCPNCRLHTTSEHLSLIAFGRTLSLLERLKKLEARVASLEERLPEPDGK